VALPGSRFSIEQIVAASKQLGFGLLVALALAGCATQEALTAKATDCTRLNLTILPSKYREQGSTTTWCAICKEQRYRCIGNADRTRVECRKLQDEVC
jgi:hypothetical protein